MVNGDAYVRDHIPLEQGLRPGLALTASTCLTGQRPYSIRTRIKTVPALLVMGDIHVRDHIPLEQGLRPDGFCRHLSSPPVRDHIPLEQGLRQSFPDHLVHAAMSETIFH